MFWIVTSLHCLSASVKSTYAENSYSSSAREILPDVFEDSEDDDDNDEEERLEGDVLCTSPICEDIHGGSDVVSSFGSLLRLTDFGEGWNPAQ